MKAKNERIEEFLKGLNIENLYVMDYVNIDDIDFSDAYQSIYEMIDDNGGFNVEIIYYRNAIDYLSKNDPSLHESLQLAADFGFNLTDLSSEVLASLLASENCRNDFSALQTDIEEFFNELCR
ncbi:MAG TPA: hypothetical protein GXZ99_07720 [Bacteroidales bacterium]|nr:hypothetical protein [Bacteroidales bacterium]